MDDSSIGEDDDEGVVFTHATFSVVDVGVIEDDEKEEKESEFDLDGVIADFERVEEERDRALRECNEAQEERARIQAEMERLADERKRESALHDKHQQQWKAEVAGLGARIVILETQSADARARAEELADELARSKTHSASVQAQLDAAFAQARLTGDELARLKLEDAQLNEDLEKAREALAEAQATLRQRQLEFDAAHPDSGELAQAQKRVKALESQLASDRDLMLRLQQTEREQNKLIENLNGDLQQSRTASEALTRRHQRVAAENLDIQRQLVELNEEINQLRADNSDLDRRLNTANEKIQQLDDELREARGELQSQTQDIENLQAAIQREKEGFIKQLNASDTSTRTLQEQLAHQTGALTSSRQREERLQQEVAHKIARIDELDATIGTLNRALEEEQKKLVTVTRALEAKEGANGVEIEHQKKELGVLNLRVADLARDNAELQQKLLAEQTISNKATGALGQAGRYNQELLQRLAQQDTQMNELQQRYAAGLAETQALAKSEIESRDAIIVQGTAELEKSKETNAALEARLRDSERALAATRRDMKLLQDRLISTRKRVQSVNAVSLLNVLEKEGDSLSRSQKHGILGTLLRNTTTRTRRRPKAPVDMQVIGSNS
jgi:chromosome segregation ATPase